MDSMIMSRSYALSPEVQTWPLDTSTKGDRFLVEVGAERRFEVTEGVHRVLQSLAGEERTVGQIVRDLKQQGFTQASAERIQALIDKVLIPRGMVAAPDGSEIEPLPAPPKRASYLRVQIPFLRPETVRPLTIFLKKLFFLPIVIPLLGVAALAHVFFYQQVFPTFDWRLTELPMEQYAILLLILNITTLWHEIGHATACRYFGCGHGRIGWGIYLYMPVLYTDVSAAWRLPRWQRAIVDAAGMYFEVLAAAAFLALYVTTDNPLFAYAFLFLNLSLLYSLNPILRRDGYWLMVDLSGQPHLRQASLELMRRGFARLFRRQAPPARFSQGMPGWMRWVLYLYTVVTILFTVRMVLWMGERILGEVIPRVPELLASLRIGLSPGSLDLLSALDAALRLGFSLLFTYFVVSLAVKFLLAIGRFLGGLFFAPRPAEATHLETPEAAQATNPRSWRTS